MSEDAATSHGPLFEIPCGERMELNLAPLTASWDAKVAPSQVALNRYLHHVEGIARTRMAELDGDLALRLDVGLAPGADPLHQHDLDNFLQPVIDRLGGKRIVSVWATKAPGVRSYLRIAPARRAAAEPGWTSWACRTFGSSSGSHWKEQVKAALGGAKELPPGPVGLQLSFTVGPSRSWPNLWKSAIDALDPILGRSSPDGTYNPKDGRIVRLGLHARTDASIGWDIGLVIRARPADLAWPEMAWFAGMSEAERDAWLINHVLRSSSTRSSRRGSSESAPPSTARRSGVVSVGDGIETVESVTRFRAAVRDGELLVITDSAGPPRLHRAAGECPSVSEENFRVKVVQRAGRNGGYFAAPSEATARARWPRLTICTRCG